MFIITRREICWNVFSSNNTLICKYEKLSISSKNRCVLCKYLDEEVEMLTASLVTAQCDPVGSNNFGLTTVIKGFPYCPYNSVVCARSIVKLSLSQFDLNFTFLESAFNATPTRVLLGGNFGGVNTRPGDICIILKTSVYQKILI